MVLRSYETQEVTCSGNGNFDKQAIMFENAMCDCHVFIRQCIGGGLLPV